MITRAVRSSSARDFYARISSRSSTSNRTTISRYLERSAFAHSSKYNTHTHLKIQKFSFTKEKKITRDVQTFKRSFAIVTTNCSKTNVQTLRCQFSKTREWMKKAWLTVRRKDTSSCSEPPSLSAIPSVRFHAGWRRARSTSASRYFPPGGCWSGLILSDERPPSPEPR